VGLSQTWGITMRLCSSLAMVTLTTWAVTAQVNDATHWTIDSDPGAHLTETTLTPAVVNVTQFGKIYSYPVDGPVYVQPWHVSRVRINGALHDVLYVATVNRTLYAFDADSGSSVPLSKTMLPSVSAGVAPSVADVVLRAMGNNPVFWDSPSHGPLVYVWRKNDFLKAYRPTPDGTMNRAYLQGGALAQGDSVASLALSANGSTHGSGIVWASLPANENGTDANFVGVVSAYDAESLNEIWTSEQKPLRDRAGRLAASISPVVANGKVYVSNVEGSVIVYGLLPPSVAPAVRFAAAPGGESTSAVGAPTLTTAAVETAVDGGAIGINFLGSSTTAMAASEIAGVVPQTHWNNGVGAARVTPLALVNAAGEPTAASVTWTANNGWMTPITDQPGNARLMKGYLDNTNTTVTTVNVAGLPSGAYDVYVYADGDNKAYTRTASYQISGSGMPAQTTTVTDPPNTTFAGTFTEAAGMSGNYVKFRINSNAFTVTARPGTSTNTNVRAPVNGIQIVPAIPSAIAINFLGASTALMAATETAGVVPQTHWNNAMGATRGTPLALVDAAGTATTASVTWKANNGWMTPIVDQPGNARMMKGYLDNSNTTVTTLSVTGLPSAVYDVFVYADGDNKAYTRTATYQLGGPGNVATAISLTDPPNTNFSGSFTQGASTGGNYVKFRMTGSTFTVTATPGTSTNGNVRAPINGIQIVRSSSMPPVELDPPATIPGIGAGQGVEVRDGKVYLYGDAATGVLREYDVVGNNSLVFTGREVLLTVNGRDLISHPTGLTTAPGLGTLVGNTVSQQGTLFMIDWARALTNGTLDGAILATVADDLAVNGTRPEFVRVGDRWLVATADYGALANEVRIYDPERLKTVARTSEPGVLVHRFPSSPYVQTLHWIDSAGVLVLVQNQRDGLGWRLTLVDLARSIAAGQQIVTQTIDLSPHSELEGFHLIAPHRGLFLTSSAVSNVYFATVRF